jgi:acetate---CoA ligase (ADP-forming)
MKTFFDPRGIAVFGVSPSPSNLAQRVVHNLVAWKFAGKIVAVGRAAGEVYGVPILAGAGDAKAFEGCDLAVILTPAAMIPGIVRRCGEVGIARAVIESSGFTELRDERAGLEHELITAAREAGVRFIGPNCVGLIRFDRGVVCDFAQIDPREAVGDAAVISQSGGVGLCQLRALDTQGAPANWMISIGNKLDIDEVALLDHLLCGEPVGRVLCYLESMPRGRAFCDVVRAHDVPVVVHKVNRTAAAVQVARSHTAALANDDAVVDAALEQAGAIRAADTRESALAVAATLLPPVLGNRVVLLSRSGGHAVIATDACVDEGLELPPFAPGLCAELDRLQPESVIQRANPLDLGDVFDFGLQARIAERICREDAFDVLVFVNVNNPTAERDAARRLVTELADISRLTGKPVAIAAVTTDDELRELRQLARWPVFGTPEEAVRAVGLLWRRTAAIKRARGEVASGGGAAAPGLGPALAAAAAGGPRVLSLAESMELLRAAGLPAAPLLRAGDPGVEALGSPLVAKHTAPAREVVHKAAAGLVRAGLRDRAEVDRAVAELERRAAELGLAGGEVVIQPQLVGPELFLGARRDPAFGPVVLFGAGGGQVEALGDVQVWPAPFTAEEIEHRWRLTRIGRVVEGRLGAAEIARWAAGLAHLLELEPRILEIDVNPIILAPSGHAAVDARLVVR